VNYSFKVSGVFFICLSIYIALIEKNKSLNHIPEINLHLTPCPIYYRCDSVQYDPAQHVKVENKHLSKCHSTWPCWWSGMIQILNRKWFSVLCFIAERLVRT